MKNDIKKVCKIRKSQTNIKHTLFSSSLYLLFTKKLSQRRKKKKHVCRNVIICSTVLTVCNRNQVVYFTNRAYFIHLITVNLTFAK